MTLLALFLGCEVMKGITHPDSIGKTNDNPDGNYHTLSFHGNNGTGSAPDSKRIKGGDETTLPNRNSLLRTNYTFVGWNTKKDYSGNDFAVGAPFIMPNNDCVLYAKWNPVNNNTPSATTYTVTYDKNGGSGNTPDPHTGITPGTKIILKDKSSSLTKDNHTFSGWNTSSDGTGKTYSPGEEFTPTKATTTLYAKWNPVSGTSPGITNPGNDIPNTPSTPSLTAKTPNSISLSWSPVAGTSGYNVYRNSSPTGNYNKVGSPSINSFTDSGLSPSTSYYYKISARNSAGDESSLSSFREATTFMDISAPLLSATLARFVDGSCVWLEWYNGTPTIFVYRSKNSSDQYTKIATLRWSSEYKDFDFSWGETYYYRISGFLSYENSDENTEYEGPLSNTVQIVIPER